jgi:putative hydrolase of the HAD superfamily
MPLNAVLFDLWGTLIVDPEHRSRPRQAWRAAGVHAVLAAYGATLAIETVDAALIAGSHALTALHDRGVDVAPAGRVDIFLDQLEASPDLPLRARAEIEQAICTMPPEHRPELAEGAVDVLRSLKAQGLATALVSNAGYTTSTNLRLILDHYGLAPHLDALVFSDELLLAKPDVRLFAAALHAVGVEAKAAAFVGDSPHNDVYGARRAGLFAVQIGHHEAPPPTGYTENDAARPDARISSLPELLPILAGFQGLSPTST